jgi:hypothetical protein
MMADEQAVLTIHFSDTATPERKADIIAAFQTIIAELTSLLTTASDLPAR